MKIFLTRNTLFWGGGNPVGAWLSEKPTAKQILPSAIGTAPLHCARSPLCLLDEAATVW